MPAFDPRALVTAEQSDVGLVRASNQDHCGEFRHPTLPRRLLIVADGMGGHRGGEVASRHAVEVAGEVFQAGDGPVDETLARAFAAANARIRDEAEANLELAGMGTTAVALAFGEEDGAGVAWIGSVGDSRVYRLRDDDFEQLTEDHSVVGELVRRGHISEDEARDHPRRNEILRALGTQLEVKTDLLRFEVAAGDRYLLCTDGLTGMLLDDEIAEVVRTLPPRDAVARLVEMANECGGTDNITVQVAEVPAAAFARVDDDPGNTAANRLRWALTLAAITGVVWLLVHQL